MDQPTIRIKIIARPIADDPLIEIISIEEVVNSTPAINSALRAFVKRMLPVRFAKVEFKRADA